MAAEPERPSVRGNRAVPADCSISRGKAKGGVSFRVSFPRQNGHLWYHRLPDNPGSMFIGHFAAGLGAKRAAPRVSLGTLLFSAQFIDLLWPTLLLLGVEHVRIAPGVTAVTPLDFTDYPISHGLFSVGVWAILLGTVYWFRRRHPRSAVVVGLLVLSHWALDLVVHRPDLPLLPWGGPRVGLGLWDSLAGTIVVEGVLLAAGLWLYARTTRARDRIGSVGLAAFVVLLVMIDVANIAGPPPPSAAAIAWAAQAQWLLVAAGWWIDRHRVTVSDSESR